MNIKAMQNEKNFFNLYGDVLNDAIALAKRLKINKKDNAIWDVIHIASYGLNLDWPLWLMENEEYLSEVSEYQSFDSVPKDLQQQVLKSLLIMKGRDKAAINYSDNGKLLTFHWDKCPVANQNQIEVYVWEVPLHAGIIEKANSRGCRIIFSKNGFTENAKKLAKKYWINLETSPLLFE